MQEIIQVALIDRHQLFREGIKLILEANELFHIVAEGEQYGTLPEASSFIDVDIILMDVNILMENKEKIKEIIEHQDTKIIVLVKQGEETIGSEDGKTEV